MLCVGRRRVGEHVSLMACHRTTAGVGGRRNTDTDGCAPNIRPDDIVYGVLTACQREIYIVVNKHFL